MIEKTHKCDLCKAVVENPIAYRIKFGYDWELCDFSDHRASETIICCACLNHLVDAKKRVENP